MVHTGKQAGSAIEWSFDDDAKVLTIAGHGYMGDVLTSESYVDDDGKERQRVVRKAPWDEFAGQTERIEVHPDVLTVSNAAFFGFTNLKDVRLPGVIVIGNGAFYLCKQLEVIQMPNVLAIGNGAFERCESLEKQLVWQEGEKKQGYVRRARFTMRKVMSVGNCAFKDAKKIRSVSMEQCASVGQYAFYGCESLEEAAFKNATQVGAGAFRGCAELKVTVDSKGKERKPIKLHDGCTLGAGILEKAGTDEGGIEYMSDESGE